MVLEEGHASPPRRGPLVSTPTLTGLGERAHLLGPDISLETHARDVIGVLTYEEMTDVILVGHSMAGTVITVVAERAPERLAHLIYLDASVPRDGENDLDRHTAAQQDWLLRQPLVGEYAVIPPSVAQPFGVTDPDDARWVNAHMAPHPRRAFTDRVAVRHPHAFADRRTYVECTGVDGQKPRSPMAVRVCAETGWRYCELASSHDAMVTAPRELTDVLLEVAARV